MITTTKPRSTSSGLKRYTKQELVAAIKESYNQASRGEATSARHFLAEIREEYGL